MSFLLCLFCSVNAGVHIENIGIEQFFDIPLLGNHFGYARKAHRRGCSFHGSVARLSDLPKGVHWGHMLAVGCLAGIGFTMALFVSNLALKPQNWKCFPNWAYLSHHVFQAFLERLCCTSWGSQPQSSQR